MAKRNSTHKISPTEHEIYREVAAMDSEENLAPIAKAYNVKDELPAWFTNQPARVEGNEFLTKARIVHHENRKFEFVSNRVSQAWDEAAPNHVYQAWRKLLSQLELATEFRGYRFGTIRQSITAKRVNLS